MITDDEKVSLGKSDHYGLTSTTDVGRKISNKTVTDENAIGYCQNKSAKIQQKYNSGINMEGVCFVSDRDRNDSV